MRPLTSLIAISAIAQLFASPTIAQPSKEANLRCERHLPSAAASAGEVLQEETDLARRVEREVAVQDFFVGTFPHLKLDGMSRYDGPTKNTIHEALWGDIGGLQKIFNQWASYTNDYAGGERFYDDVFYRFFFVHEFGHWLSDQVLAQRRDKLARYASENADRNRWEYEMAANRISIAWWREHNPAFMMRLIDDFKNLLAKLPSPVPPNSDPKLFFARNYEVLAKDPNKYGWYQFQMVALAYDEKPVLTFRQVIRKLPSENYDN